MTISGVEMSCYPIQHTYHEHLLYCRILSFPEVFHQWMVWIQHSENELKQIW